MERHKEIGYDLCDIYWHNIDGFKNLWNNTDIKTKDKCVNGIGKLALKLCKKEYEENDYKETLNLLKKREDEYNEMVIHNIRLRKHRNYYRVASIILLIICIILMIGNSCQM